MATYLLVDTMNTFFRAKHVVRGDISEKVGMGTTCYTKCNQQMLQTI